MPAAAIGVDRGAVHLFSFSDTNFSGATLQGTIGSGYTGGKNLNVALPDSAAFGGAVALNADAPRLAVGAVGDNLGAVRLFSFGDNQFAAPALTHTLGAGYGTAGLGNAGNFGSAVALNALGNRLAVGALGDSGNGGCGYCGAVYLFNNGASSATLVKAIGAGYGANLALPYDAQFGTSVAFDASGDKLAVGAYGVDNSQRRGLPVHRRLRRHRPRRHGRQRQEHQYRPQPGRWLLGSVSLNSAGTRLAVGASGAGGGFGSVTVIDFANNAFGGASVSAILGSGNNEGAGADAGLEAMESFGWNVALNGAGDRLVVGSPLERRRPQRRRRLRHRARLQARRAGRQPRLRQQSRRECDGRCRRAVEPARRRHLDHPAGQQRHHPRVRPCAGRRPATATAR